MITSSLTSYFLVPINVASIGYSQKSGMRMEPNTRCALARPHRRPASEELSIFPIIFDPRGRMGGLFTKNRTSAATVKRTGPEVVPATMCSSGYTRIIVPAGMLIEQDVSLGLAKAIEVRHDKPRKTAASIVLFVAFILAFLLFLGLFHFNDPLPTAGFVGRRAAYRIVCHTKWRCGFRSSNDLEARPKVTFHQRG